MEVPRLVALLHGPDRTGLVARTAGWIFERGGNILHADQHRDETAGIFFQRIEWHPAEAPSAAAEAAAFAAWARQDLGMTVETHTLGPRPAVAVFVSRTDHCLHELALRARDPDWPGRLATVVSNHADLEPAARAYGLPFHLIPVGSGDKSTAEDQALRVLDAADAGLIVLARYMQILSAEFLARCGRPVINIHHSFLPAFAGGRPYHQAHDRGVKLIGATAHYATADLDEGPIIHQDVVRVTHRDGVRDLIRRGRDLEKLVLAEAVRWHLERRVLVYGRKTVVFD